MRIIDQVVQSNAANIWAPFSMIDAVHASAANLLSLPFVLTRLHLNIEDALGGRISGRGDDQTCQFVDRVEKLFKSVCGVTSEQIPASMGDGPTNYTPLANLSLSVISACLLAVLIGKLS